MRQYSNRHTLGDFGLLSPFPLQSVALYVLGDESAVSNEASRYLYKITTGNDALVPPQGLLVSCACYVLSFCWENMELVNECGLVFPRTTKTADGTGWRPVWGF